MRLAKRSSYPNTPINSEEGGRERPPEPREEPSEPEAEMGLMEWKEKAKEARTNSSRFLFQMELDHQINSPGRFFFSWSCLCISPPARVLCYEISQGKHQGLGVVLKLFIREGWLWREMRTWVDGRRDKEFQGCWVREGGWRLQSHPSGTGSKPADWFMQHKTRRRASKVLFISSKVSFRLENKFFLKRKKMTPALGQPCAPERKWRGGAQ